MEKSWKDLVEDLQAVVPGHAGGPLLPKEKRPRLLVTEGYAKVHADPLTVTPLIIEWVSVAIVARDCHLTTDELFDVQSRVVARATYLWPSHKLTVTIIGA